ncbi:Protein CBG05513 [Caenorhabditis briggsae]|uniref:Protein CBG05513 n=1 Tax=Caenorhabditis briggsae TaxID=6238 RepID=A8X022_CAEBR|nr:Protein CBG05513 [Caenorhabditis briggsae]CAP25982.2 Protein CBG05513 [Caenorhabditis briggsae]
MYSRHQKNSNHQSTGSRDGQSQSLFQKQPRNRNGDSVKLFTNLREIIFKEGFKIFKYTVNVTYITMKDGGKTETFVEVSKSIRKDSQLEQDKIRSFKVVKEAFNLINQLREDRRPRFYDCQGCLYTFATFLKPSYSITLKDGISTSPVFLRASFQMTRSRESFEMTVEDIKNTVSKYPGNENKSLLYALKTIIEGMMNPVFVETSDFRDTAFLAPDGMLHLINGKTVGLGPMEFEEGILRSSAGIKTEVKALESTGTPKVFASHDLRNDLFHPEKAPLFDVLASFMGFRNDLEATSNLAKKISNAVSGLDFTLNYGDYPDLQEDEVIFKIDGFSKSANEIKQIVADKEMSLREVFKAKERMINGEQQDVDLYYGGKPHITKKYTDDMVISMFLESAAPGISFRKQLELRGIVLKKPKIVFRNGSAQTFLQPVSLKKWTVVFVRKEEVEDLVEMLLEQWNQHGMEIAYPNVDWMGQDNNLEVVFHKAQKREKQLLPFVTHSRYALRKDIEWMEHKYRIPSLAIDLKIARKMVEDKAVKLDLADQVNKKTQGVNYAIYSDVFRNGNDLVISISFSEPSPKYAKVRILILFSHMIFCFQYPFTVGFAANTSNHPLVFTSEFLYSNSDNMDSGAVLTEIFYKCLTGTRKNRGELPTRLIIYLDEVPEEEFWRIDHHYEPSCAEACSQMGAEYNPQTTMIVATQKHNERFYKIDDKCLIWNPEPGTIIDHTAVSPVFNEFYHIGPSTSYKSTVKPAKYTVVYASDPVDMEHLEQLTNDLCYWNQLKSELINVPAPLDMAQKEASKGIQFLIDNGGPIYMEDGEVDLAETNAKYGYGNMSEKL